MSVLSYLNAEPKFKANPQPRDGHFTVLGVRAGNHSARKMKRVFPYCTYHAVDRVTDYNNDDLDRQKMNRFCSIDPEELDAIAEIPNSFYDVIVLAHVIEHLRNGPAAIRSLPPNLKPGSSVYIEFPPVRSLSLPSMRGTLNSSDDPTHVRLYDLRELGNLLLDKGFRIVRGGARRDWIRILLTPVLLVRTFMQKVGVQASVFWNLLGFAEYIHATRLR